MTKENPEGYGKNFSVLQHLNVANHTIRPFASILSAGSISGGSPSQAAIQAKEEDAQQLKLQSSLAEQESQLPPQPKSEKTVIRELYFKIIKVETAKYKLIDEFNELGIWHQNIIKDLGSKEFITKLIDLNSYNPKELTQNQVTIIIEQSDELIKLFTDRTITNFKKEGAVDGVYKEFLSEDSPSKEAIQPTNDNAKFKSHRSVLKNLELQPPSQSEKEILQTPLSQSEQEIGKLHLQLLEEKTKKDKNETELKKLKIWHKDIITYLGSNEFLDKLRKWNPHNPEELIVKQRDELIDLLTYRKIAITQPSVEAGPASQEDVRGFGNRAEVPQSSIAPQRRLNESVSSKGANNQGSRN